MKETSKLTAEYLVQIRNIAIVFFHERRDYSVTKLAQVFDVDKSTISRIIQKHSYSEKGLDALDNLLQ